MALVIRLLTCTFSLLLAGLLSLLGSHLGLQRA